MRKAWGETYLYQTRKDNHYDAQEHCDGGACGRGAGRWQELTDRVQPGSERTPAVVELQQHGPPAIVGVNATKSGEHLATSFVKKPLDVAYEECTEKHGNATLLSSRVVAKENKKLCLKHESGPGRDLRLLVLDECKKDKKDDTYMTKEFTFHAVYGKGMKGQNATLVALHSEGQYQPAWGLPFVQIYPHFHDSDSDKNVTTDVVGISTMSNVLLQIGNATEH